MRSFCSSQRSRPVNLPVIIILLLITTFDHSHGLRSAHGRFFKLNPRTSPSYRREGQFFGFLPKSVRNLPASGPSKKHNGIDFQSWKSP